MQCGVAPGSAVSDAPLLQQLISFCDQAKLMQSYYNEDNYYNNLSCSDLEPEWLDDIQQNGELFYLELSEGEEEAALAQANAVATNHVRFSETEAEIISEQNKKHQSSSWTKKEPTLKRLARMLRRKQRTSQRREGKEDPTFLHPPSILKNQPSQRQGVTVQQQHRKEVCVYLNPKRLGSSPLKSEKAGLLEALLGVIHHPSWGSGQMCTAVERKEERLMVHGLIPNSPAIKCSRILIGKRINSSCPKTLGHFCHIQHYVAF